MSDPVEFLGELIGWHDPDENRQWVRENKPRQMIDKRTTVSAAVREYVKPGSLLAIGGFGHIRIPMALIYEIIRQQVRDLTMIGKTAVHDIDLLIGGGCVSRVEVAYAFGHELRGLSACGRRAVESGRVQVTGEISNAGYQWRFLAAAMGVPFMPVRTMLGTETLTHSSARVIDDPWSGKPLCLLPACYPDVTLFHVHRCDKYGNAQIDGILVEDFELARASRRLIITTEKLVDHEEIERQPWRTAIPFYLPDAVIEVPFGAHPTEMPTQYYFDEEHIAHWMEVSKTDAGTRAYLDEYVFGVPDFEAYLEKIGGQERRKQLERLMDLRPKAEGGTA
ncbi:MAG: CoA transferase subunit A [Anaerolineales bacterium]|nr:CoA transferase subunit A [Anaerolineales bacterium]